MAELDQRLSSYELTEWMLYEKISGPLGRRRQDIQAATVAAAISNAMRGKGGKRSQISDFLIPYDRAGIRQSPEEMLKTLRGITTGMGGRVVEKAEVD